MAYLPNRTFSPPSAKQYSTLASIQVISSTIVYEPLTPFSCVDVKHPRLGLPLAVLLRQNKPSTMCTRTPVTFRPT